MGSGRDSYAGYRQRGRQHLLTNDGSVRADALDERAESHLDADLVQATSRPGGYRLTEGATPQAAARLEHRDAQTERGERGGHLDADESSTDDDRRRVGAGRSSR